MKMRRLVIAAWLLAALAVPAFAEPSCQAPPELLPGGPGLPVAHAAVAERHALTILTLGGASTAGMIAHGGAYSYPARLAAHLQELLPGTKVVVVNRAVMAGTVRAQFDKLGADLMEIHPDLVIWAPGSTEAGAAMDPNLFLASLNKGVGVIRAAGADLLIMDLPYSPSIARAINLPPYNDAIIKVATEQHLTLLRRSALMRHWHETGVLDLDATPKKGHVAAMRRLFDCLAAALADGIAGTVAETGSG